MIFAEQPAYLIQLLSILMHEKEIIGLPFCFCHPVVPASSHLEKDTLEEWHAASLRESSIRQSSQGYQISTRFQYLEFTWELPVAECVKDMIYI